jgi:iron(III) transport system ATP-binding protein
MVGTHNGDCIIALGVHAGGPFALTVSRDSSKGGRSLVEPKPEAAPVEVRGLWHRYRSAHNDWTLQGIDLELEPGELVGLLGPSGCGKTTLLRLIAGFEVPSLGEVRMHGQPVATAQRWIPPERRGVGMVFQDYALFPHLTAWDNTCFGLRRGQDTSRAAWLLELLGLERLTRRYPHELSGGQRQRLALARALAPAPAVVLLDEPFSNLDVEVRLRLRSELPAVLSRCGTSGVLVTHDPGEALAICDRVAVMQDGILHQCATPRTLVESPASSFVGRFVLQGNLLPVERQASGRWHCLLGSLQAVQSGAPEQVRCAEPDSTLEGHSTGPGREDPVLLVDPAAIDLRLDPDGDACVMGREFLGREWLYRVEAGGQQLRLLLPLQHDYRRGTRCRLSLRPDETVLLYPERTALVGAP